MTRPLYFLFHHGSGGRFVTSEFPAEDGLTAVFSLVETLGAGDDDSLAIVHRDILGKHTIVHEQYKSLRVDASVYDFMARIPIVTKWD